MKQADKQGKKNEIGAHGEQIAATYLTRRGFVVIEQNYLRKWGELDIIAREVATGQEILHFVEVKTVSYGTKAALDRAVLNGTWRPEENVHHHKLLRMNRAIETWLAEKGSAAQWQIDVAAVRIVPSERYATIKYLPNIIE